MKYFKDGDQLCIVNDDFINLQESDAAFVDYDSSLAKGLMSLIDDLNIISEGKIIMKDKEYYENEIKKLSEIIVISKDSAQIGNCLMGIKLYKRKIEMMN